MSNLNVHLRRFHLIEIPQTNHNNIIIKDEQRVGENNATNTLSDLTFEVKEEDIDFKTCDMDNY